MKTETQWDAFLRERFNPLAFGGHCYYVRKCLVGNQVEGGDIHEREIGGIILPQGTKRTMYLDSDHKTKVREEAKIADRLDINVLIPKIIKHFFTKPMRAAEMLVLMPKRKEILEHIKKASPVFAGEIETKIRELEAVGSDKDQEKAEGRQEPLEKNMFGRVLALGPAIGTPCSARHSQDFERAKHIAQSASVGDLVLIDPAVGYLCGDDGCRQSPLSDCEYYIEESKVVAIFKDEEK